MPLSYPGGTIAEHQACRTDAVVFDVSHLGTVRVEGGAAFDLLQSQLSNDLGKVRPGRAQYTHLLDDADGSVTDDIIVWWLRDELFDVMPNASNTTRVLDALGGKDTTAERVILAVQGPHARAKLSSVSEQAASVPRFGVTSFEWLGSGCTVAGTGYTGEDGVECSVPVEVATSFFEAVLGAGIRPAGLGARDTLRLEAGLPLHGHELGPGITPLQCGLGWVVGWDKESFRGKAALERERRVGTGAFVERPRRRRPASASRGQSGGARVASGRPGDQREFLARPRTWYRIGLLGNLRKCDVRRRAGCPGGRERDRRPGDQAPVRPRRQARRRICSPSGAGTTGCLTTPLIPTTRSSRCSASWA